MHKAERPAHTRIAENPQSFKRRRHHYGKEAERQRTGKRKEEQLA